MVVKWPPRLTLASGLFWWVCLNISEYAPKASANMQFPINFDHLGVLQPCIIISDFRNASGFPWLPSPFNHKRLKLILNTFQNIVIPFHYLKCIWWKANLCRMLLYWIPTTEEFWKKKRFCFYWRETLVWSSLNSTYYFCILTIFYMNK